MLTKAGGGRAFEDGAVHSHKASAHHGTPLVELVCRRVDLAQRELRILISQSGCTERILRAFLLHMSFTVVYVQWLQWNSPNLHRGKYRESYRSTKIRGVWINGKEPAFTSLFNLSHDLMPFNCHFRNKFCSSLSVFSQQRIHNTFQTRLWQKQSQLRAGGGWQFK